MAPQRQPDQSAPKTVSPTGVPYEGPKEGRDPRAQAGDFLTSPNGVRIPDTDHSLKAGPRGPVLLEDFHLREKIMHFDHERIPERVVHARGAGAHGVFTANGAAATVSKAAVLAEKGLQTPVFVRFSTVLGSRGSADTVRDTRGFATKFYTKEGTWDLVGNNMPVFFIQDAIKFPDIVHAAKPHPDVEIPQAQSAHDTFWVVGTLVLNGNPTNFFAETEQVAFHTGHLVPGIEGTNDPLLQGRNFSYLDTQLTRLGGPNFTQIPINRPHAPVNDNSRDGFHQHAVHEGQAPYTPNSVDDGSPFPASADDGGYVF